MSHGFAGPVAALLTLALVLAGCNSRPGTVSDVQVQVRVQPQPPRVGEAEVTVLLTGPDQRPVPGATVRLEGNMSHAGMQPVFADAREAAPGRYEARLELTMGGDWFIIVTGTLPDGRKLEHQAPLPGVRSQ
ncbi:MAG: FixH family protein [Actinomycetota bacterium]